jgi:hypothetical protein
MKTDADKKRKPGTVPGREYSLDVMNEPQDSHEPRAHPLRPRYSVALSGVKLTTPVPKNGPGLTAILPYCTVA